MIDSYLTGSTVHRIQVKMKHASHPKDRRHYCHAVSFTNNFFFNQNDTFTSPIITGTSTRGPMTAAKACPEAIPKTATATAIASSKLLLAAVNESVTVFL